MAPYYYVYFRSQQEPFYYYAGYVDGPISGPTFRENKMVLEDMGHTYRLIHWMLTGKSPKNVHIRPYDELLKVLNYWKTHRKVLYEDLAT